jgi:hypothetical protein
MKHFEHKNNVDDITTILHKVERNMSLRSFESIFDYGDENSGQLLYNRFQDEHNRNIVSFYLSLCDIDRAKLFKEIRFYENMK